MMIVCICGRVSDKTIRKARDEGMDITEVMQTFNCSMQCGCCFDTLVEIMEETPNGENRGISE